MNTLTTPPVSTLLARLFEDANKADGVMRNELARRSPSERDAFMAMAKSDYRAFYGQAKNLYLPVSPETGALLYMLARATKARSIVEFGTSFGISTIHLASALVDNGGGRLIGSEFESAKAASARQNLATAGLTPRADVHIDIREGDALESLAHDLPEAIDFVLLDGAKILYPRILALLAPRLTTGAVIIADNADDSPEYLAHVRQPSSGFLSAAFSGDVELTVRVGS